MGKEELVVGERGRERNKRTVTLLIIEFKINPFAK